MPNIYIGSQEDTMDRALLLYIPIYEYWLKNARNIISFVGYKHERQLSK